MCLGVDKVFYQTALERGLCFSSGCMYVGIIVWHALWPERLDGF